MDRPRDERNGMGDYVRHTAEHEINCQRFVELVTDYFEGALTEQTRTHVEEHLVMCDWCTTYTEQMQATIQTLSGLGSEEASGEPATAETPSAEPPPLVLAALRTRRESSR